MKKLSSLFVAIVSCWLAISCGNSSENSQELSNIPDGDIETSVWDLPGYRWLKNTDNFSHENYKDSVYYYHNFAIENNKLDDASIYILMYSDLLKQKMEFDSIYFNDCRIFYNTFKEKLSGESLTNIAYNLGKQSHQNQNLNESSKWFKKAINIPTENKTHKQMQGFSNFALAQNYSLLRDFEMAEEHLIEALSIFVDVDDKTNQGTVNLLLHNIYMQRGVYEEAEKTLEKGLQIVKKQQSDPLIAGAYGLYVHLNVAKTDTLSAIKYIDSLAIHAQTYTNQGTYNKAILNQLLAFKHIAKREEQEALNFLNISRNITDNTNSPDLQMRTLFQELMFSEVFDKPLKNPEEVEAFYNKVAADQDPNRQYMVQLGSALYKYYNNKENYKKANTYVGFLLKDKDEAIEEAVRGRLFEVEGKFKAEQKEKKILLQEKQLEEQKVMIMSLGAGAVFLILIFLLFLIWSKNRSILREKLLTENFSSLLLSKTEDERKRIASDLHDSVSNELINLRHTLENKSSNFSAKIDSILEEVRNISRNLSPTLFDKLGLKDSIEQLTERAQNQHRFLLTSDVNYSGTLSTSVELQLYRIIQEATTNIIKHANALAGKITIYEDTKFVYAEVKDNGKGFDATKMLEKGNCFGLLNITERAKFVNGTVQFKSDKYGTIIKISIPK